MSLPEGYLPREGDVLVLHVTVKHDVDSNNRNVFVLIPPNKNDIAVVPLKSFVAIKHREWKEGEKVRHRNIDKCFGEVVAMDGDFVWVRLGNYSIHPKQLLCGFMTVHCNDIEIDPMAIRFRAIYEKGEPTLNEVAEVVKPKEEPDVAF